MAKYRKKPVIIDAVQWNGHNEVEIQSFFGKDAIGNSPTIFEDCLLISTLEGIMKASKGDYIIKGVHGEFYPCKPDIFKETYEEIE